MIRRLLIFLSRIILLFDYLLWRMIFVNIFSKIGYKSFIARPYYIYNPKYMEIGSNFKANRNLRMEAYDNYGMQKLTPKIVIGNNVSFETDCHIGCINRIEIGNNVLIASRVFITDHFHGQNNSIEELKIAPVERQLYSKGPVIIKDNVWIGQNVSIMPNVIIGNNVIIGANSVVTKDIPDNCIVAGNPAKILKTIK